MPSASLNFHDYQFKWQVPAGTWRWTTRIDTSGATPRYEVRDIVSPFGLLRDSIPLPGEVVQEMAASITRVQTSFAPSVLLSGAVLSFTLDEGRGFGLAQSVSVTNNGAFGSLLSTAVTSSAPYVHVDPANVAGLQSGASGSFQVSVDSTDLLASGSPYAVTLTVQDSHAVNSPQVVNVTVTVRPKATITLLPDDLGFNVSGPYGGPWPSIPSQTFQVVNSGPGGSVLDYQIQKLLGNSDWITSITPTFGTVGGGGSSTVSVTCAPTPNMLPGVYEETLRVSGYSSNSYQDVLVTLTVT